MSAWKPRLNPAMDLRTLPLSPEEGFLASRLDGTTALRELALITGLPEQKVSEALTRLVAQGAVLPEETTQPARPPTQPLAHDSGAEAEPLPPENEVDGEPEPEAPENPSHRQLYETTLHPLSADERCARARVAEEPELSALCYDPLPAVVQALLENPRMGPSQARLVAQHHRNPVGLEAIAARGAFSADAVVRRNLVRNPQLSAGLFRRLFAGRRLLEQFKLAQSRDLPEQNRRTARELMRSRFASGPAEERVELILKSEGRCLAQLVGLSIDSKTTALLCGRPLSSTMLLQNLARWSAAPPPLVAHLLRQEVVRRSPQLRALIQRHPNAPSEAKHR